MARFIRAVSVIAIGLCVLSEPARAERVWVCDANGISFESRLSDAEITALPRWIPADDNPPIGARSAMSAAEKIRPQYETALKLGKGRRLEFSSIALYELQQSERWVWEIRYDEYLELQRTGTAIRIIVPMTGNALQPTLRRSPQ